jgi:hypothetical protein
MLLCIYLISAYGSNIGFLKIAPMLLAIASAFAFATTATRPL